MRYANSPVHIVGVCVQSIEQGLRSGEDPIPHVSHDTYIQPLHSLGGGSYGAEYTLLVKRVPGFTIFHVNLAKTGDNGGDVGAENLVVTALVIGIELHREMRVGGAGTKYLLYTQAIQLRVTTSLFSHESYRLTQRHHTRVSGIGDFQGFNTRHVCPISLMASRNTELHHSNGSEGAVC